MICINCNPLISKPDGTFMQVTNSMIYLGGLISDDGTITIELSRRDGIAYCDFSALQRVWSHANTQRKRNMQMINACIISKLLYGLDVAWLRQNELSRFDEFQARSLRRIYGIQHSYFSRISNKQILKSTSSINFNLLLHQLQLMLF